MVRLAAETLLLKKRQSFPLLDLRQFSEHWHSCLLSYGEDSLCQSNYTHQPSISCISLLLQVKYHHIGQHQSGQSGINRDEYFTKVKKKGSPCMLPIIAEKSPWGCLVYNQDVSQCLLQCSGKYVHQAEFREFCKTLALMLHGF